uniref:Uncharacterized protein n=1 Tax=Ceratitis capitata TaxID=7213 RepID=W8BVS9_CERCA
MYYICPYFARSPHHKPLLNQTTFRSGYLFLRSSCTSDSSLSTLRLIFCGHKAHPIGVAKIKRRPHITVCSGGLSQGLRLSSLPGLSSLSIKNGVKVIPGIAIEMRLSTTSAIPVIAARLDAPTSRP